MFFKFSTLTFLNSSDHDTPSRRLGRTLLI